MIKTREQWLKERRKGVGASEASAVLGLNPYMTNIELWQIKTGRIEPEDISHKPYVKYGIESEPHLRALFALDFPQYEVDYKKYDLFRNPKYPFIFATLDGRLVEKATGRKGVLEIKTTEILKSMQKESWKDKVPDNYYIQTLQQLLATGWDFVILKAQLKYDFDGEVFLQTKHYCIERSEVEEDLEYLEEKEVKFWTKNVLEDKRPDLILPAL
jgi:putative phage-type endonuclease